MQATKSDSFRSYFVTLRFQTSGEELQHLINVMTVNETYFFREEYHFACMISSMLPEISARKKPGDTIRIWSIPSSSGEEPYSIAIYLQEYWNDLDKFNVELMASDIDTTILEQAQKGIFSERSVGNIPAHVTNKYFRKDKNGMYHLDPDTRSAVEFSRVNRRILPIHANSENVI